MVLCPSITDVLLAARFLRGRIRRTPLERSFPLSDRTGAQVFVKWENQQLTGSFKLRGALNRVCALTEEERARGVVTASSGNHAQGVATAAALLGVRAVICVPGGCPETKRRAILDRGGDWVDLRVVGTLYDEAEAEALRLARTEGFAFVSAYEDLRVAAGQGTLGLEMLEDEPELEDLLVPLSGGGLLSGVTAAACALRPGIRIYGVHAAANPSWAEAWSRGRVVPVQEEPSLADALSGAASQALFEFLRPRLAGLVAVTEEEIGDAMAWLHRHHHQVVEGGGSVAVAALLAERLDLAGRRVGVVVSGGNVDDRRLIPLLEERGA